MNGDRNVLPFTRREKAILLFLVMLPILTGLYLATFWKV